MVGEDRFITNMKGPQLLILGAVGWGLYAYWDKIVSAFGNGSNINPMGTGNNSGGSQTTNSTIPPTPQSNTSGGGSGTSIPGLVVTTPVLTPYNPVTAPVTNTDFYSQLRRYVANNPSFLTDGKASFDQWNWAAQQVGFTFPGIEEIFPGMDRSFQLTRDEYWTGINNMGLAGLSGVSRLSGIGGMGGLGMIFDSALFNNWYQTTQLKIPSFGREGF